MSRTEKVEEIVLEKTALSFTKLKKESGLENGALQHHIRKSDEIQKKKDAIVHKEKCRDCSLASFCRKKCVFKILESDTTRKILEAKAEGLKNSEIAEKIGVHSSTVTYHVSKLEENSLLEEGNLKTLADEDMI